MCRSPAYSHLGELRAFAPSGAPMLAATATVTDAMRREVLEMEGCAVSHPTNLTSTTLSNNVLTALIETWDFSLLTS